MLLVTKNTEKEVREANLLTTVKQRNKYQAKNSRSISKDMKTSTVEASNLYFYQGTEKGEKLHLWIFIAITVQISSLWKATQIQISCNETRYVLYTKGNTHTNAVFQIRIFPHRIMC